MNKRYPNNLILVVVKGTLLSAVIGTLFGCTVGPDHKVPEVPLPDNFTLSSESYTNEQVHLTWWRSFEDGELNELIESAVNNNKDIDISLARLKQSRAGRTEAAQDLYPSLTARASYDSTTQSESGPFRGIPGFDRNFESFIIGFDTAWELDFFGRVRRGVEAATANEDARREDLFATLQSVVAEVARNYFELRGIQHQLDVARKNSENQSETVRITKVLERGGESTELDAARAESQYQSTLSIIPLLEYEEKQAIHRISVLTGQFPTALVEQLSKPKNLPDYNGPISIGDPATLLKRRPDIRAAERDLARATARVGVTMGDYFPKVTFNGTISLQADSLSGLGDARTDAFSYGPSITWPAFSMARVMARVRGAKGVAEEASKVYEQRVLLALEEVENALMRFSTERRRYGYLKEASIKSKHASDLGRIQYQAGLIDFLTLLDSERQTLSTQDQLAKSRTALLTYLIGIYKSLGGGWEGYELRAS